MLIAEKLRRLSEMDLPEMRFRMAQKLRIKREQWRLAMDGKQLEDPEWWRHWDVEKVADPELEAALRAGDGARAADSLPAYFMKRKTPAFYWDVSERDQIVAALASQFAPNVEKINAEAEAICAHRFRIFCYPEISCGSEIPWRRDLVHGVESSLDHYARIPCLEFGEVGDSKIVWEVNRHQHFITLCRAYQLTGEERFAEECLVQWEGWFQQNPYLRGINWASSLEVAFRSWSWLWTLYLLLGSRALTGERIGRMTLALSRNTEFVAENLSTYFAPNTHLLGEGFALFVIGLLLPELKQSSTWKERGRQILAEEMTKQVRNDGTHFEQSVYYHRYAAEFFLCAAILADRNGCPFPTVYRSRLETMLEHLVYTAWPSGSHPSLGDSDGGRLIPFEHLNSEDHRPILSTGAVYFHRGDFRTAAGPLQEQTLWLLGRDAAARYAGINPALPATTSRTFLASGTVTMRSDWGKDGKLLIFDAGPQGIRHSGHGHADALSFVCGANGVEWLIDPGTYIYSAARAWRDFFRSTSAHNTIVVDGLDQAVPVDWFKWRKLPRVRLERTFAHRCLDYAIGCHDGYARLQEPVFHRRHVTFVKPDYWVISDELTGQGEHRVSVFFHFAPGALVQPVEQGWLATKGSERFLLIPLASGVQFRVVTGEESPIQGWFSSAYGQCEPAPVLVGEAFAAFPVSFHWLLWPVQKELPKLRELSGSGRLLSVETNRGTDFLAIGAAQRRTSEAKFLTDAALAFVRWQKAGAMERLVLLSGSSVQSEEGEVLVSEKPFEHFVATWKAGGVEIEANPARAFRLQSPPIRRARLNGKAVEPLEAGGVLVFQGES